MYTDLGKEAFSQWVGFSWGFCLVLVLGFFKEKNNNYNQQMLLELKGKSSLISLSGMAPAQCWGSVVQSHGYRWGFQPFPKGLLLPTWPWGALLTADIPHPGQGPCSAPGVSGTHWSLLIHVHTHMDIPTSVFLTEQGKGVGCGISCDGISRACWVHAHGTPP